MRRAALFVAALLLAGCGEEPVELSADRVLRGSVRGAASGEMASRVHALGAASAFVELAGGRTLETTDAGRTWTPVEIRSPYGEPRFLSRTHWLASRGRVLFETRDGGATWRRAQRLADPLRATNFRTRTLAYRCAPRRCALSVDGGRSILRPPAIDCSGAEGSSIAFSGARSGLALCGGVPGAGQQLKGGWRWNGERWRALPEPPTYGYVGELEPLGPDSYVHHSGRANDLITEDAGRTWRSALPAETGAEGSWVDPRVGWALDPFRGQVFRTTNGGRRWQWVGLGFWPAGTTSFCDTREGYGIGAPDVQGLAQVGDVYATTDGGRTWSRRARMPDFGAATLTCVAPGEVLISAYPPINSGGAVVLMRSRDGGRSWRRLRVPDDAYPAEIVARDTYLARKDGTTSYVTRDGARTWQTVRPSRTEPLEALAFVSRGVGFAITSEAAFDKTPSTRLLRTEDGGQTWAAVPTKLAGFSPRSLTAAGGTLWVHAPRRTLRTSDGGRSWDEIRLRRPPPLDAHFASAELGVAPDYFGIWITRDGGVHWTRFARDPDYS